jgi:hypothetical protein
MSVPTHRALGPRFNKDKKQEIKAIKTIPEIMIPEIDCPKILQASAAFESKHH